MARKLKIAKDMTTEMVAAYITNEGQNCPFCNEPSPTGESFDVGGKYAAQEMGCENCNKEWIDGWRRISVTHKGVIFEPTEEGKAPGTESEQLKGARTDCLHELFSKLRAADFDKVSDVMREIASFIAHEERKPANV